MRQTEHERILNLLKSYPNDYCPLPKILDLHISQYGRVFRDLRLKGYIIENKIFGIVDGVKHTGFKLVYEPPEFKKEPTGQMVFV